MLSTDTFFGFARCSYLGSVDLTLSGISITQGRAALKWLRGSLEVSAGCGVYLQGKSVILFPGDWTCNKGSFPCWRGQVWGSCWFEQPSETQSMENVELPIKATSHLPHSIKLLSNPMGDKMIEWSEDNMPVSVWFQIISTKTIFGSSLQVDCNDAHLYLWGLQGSCDINTSPLMLKHKPMTHRSDMLDSMKHHLHWQRTNGPDLFFSLASPAGKSSATRGRAPAHPCCNIPCWWYLRDALSLFWSGCLLIFSSVSLVPGHLCWHSSAVTPFAFWHWLCKDLNMLEWLTARSEQSCLNKNNAVSYSSDACRRSPAPPQWLFLLKTHLLCMQSVFSFPSHSYLPVKVGLPHFLSVILVTLVTGWVSIRRTSQYLLSVGIPHPFSLWLICSFPLFRSLCIENCSTEAHALWGSSLTAVIFLHFCMQNLLL